MPHDNISDGRNITAAGQNWDNDGIEYNQNTNTYKLVRALVSEYDRIDDEIVNIADSHHIDTATGEDLGKIAEPVGLERKDNESDDKFRARIKVQYRVGNIGATFDEFAEFAAVLLSTTIENVEYRLNLEGDPATARVAAETQVYDDVALTRNEVSKFLGRAVPAGHEVKALEKGSFRLKADGDTDDATKGLTSDSTSDGGTLAADIL